MEQKDWEQENIIKMWKIKEQRRLVIFGKRAGMLPKLLPYHALYAFLSAFAHSYATSRSGYNLIISNIRRDFYANFHFFLKFCELWRL